jgi:hypothetical protein
MRTYSLVFWADWMDSLRWQRSLRDYMETLALKAQKAAGSAQI